MIDQADYQALADRHREGEALERSEHERLLAAAIERRNYLLVRQLSDGAMLLDRRQAALVREISDRLSTSQTNQDLLVAAAQAARMTVLEAILTLDQITYAKAAV